MKTNPTFPPSRRTDPQRRAERDIYQAVEASSLPGRALYEVKSARNAKQWTSSCGPRPSPRSEPS